MTLEFGYDTGVQKVDVPEENLLEVLTPNEVPLPEADEETLVRTALEHPIGAPRLREIVRPGEKIAIVTSDVSRPMPTWKVMGPLLDELYAAGAAREDITLGFGRGGHRAQTEGSAGIWRGSGPGRRSPAWTPTRRTRWFWAPPAGAPRWS